MRRRVHGSAGQAAQLEVRACRPGRCSSTKSRIYLSTATGQAVCAMLQSGKSSAGAVLPAVPVDLRIISATNKDLREPLHPFSSSGQDLCADRHLEHLVPRSAGTPRYLPLAEHFIRRHELRLKTGIPVSPTQSSGGDRRYPWPAISGGWKRRGRAVHLAEGGALLPKHFGIWISWENRRPCAPAPARATPRRHRAAGHRRRPRPFWREHQSERLCPRHSAAHTNTGR